ncbi:MAG: S-layer homology domain-containing protein, partial [Bacilli bacterium]
YAAVDLSFGSGNYGKTVNDFRQFNSNANIASTATPFLVDYNPATSASNSHPFTVPNGLTELVVKVNATGIDGETGNPINVVLIAPDGTEYSSGVSLLFTLEYGVTTSVTSPMSGEWKVELRGLRGDVANPIGVALPEKINGTITFKTASGFTGLNDIAGHPAEAAIKLAVGERLLDGYGNSNFKPNQTLTRSELAQYLTMGAEIRQSLPGATFSDVADVDAPFIAAVTAKGAAVRDRFQAHNGVMLPTTAGTFSPSTSVTRADLAYSLVQSLGLQEEAVAKNGDTLTVQYGDQRLPIEDATNIPANLCGYVQTALDMNILNAYFTVSQGPYDLSPTVHATFKPTNTVTRGDFAVAITRFFSAYLTQ